MVPASQYKNCNNFTNLCFHHEDFDIHAEWNFFTTSHGKTPCDGIGGTVKRLVRRASLQAATNRSHPTCMPWASMNIKNIHFFYISSDDVAAHKDHIEDRMLNAKTVVLVVGATTSLCLYQRMNFRCTDSQVTIPTQLSASPTSNRITLCHLPRACKSN